MKNQIKQNVLVITFVLLIGSLFFGPIVRVSAERNPVTTIIPSTNLFQAGGGTIQGIKWHDLNGNGSRDTGEPGLAGWTIFLDTNNNGQLDVGEKSTLTSSSGDYAFTGLTTPSTYSVAEVVKPGWRQGYPGGITVPSGNILVTTSTFIGSILPSRLYEYTPGGTQVNNVLVPYGEVSRPSTEIVRDVVVGGDGQAYIYNGTFNPYLSIYNFGTTSWQHSNFTGWSTVNNVSYGGIALDNNFVYLTDMSTAGSGSPQGIVRFDRTDFGLDRFTSTSYIDITMGLDGLIYALRSDEQTVDIFNQQTNCGQIGSVSLGADVRGIAVNGQGEIFGASWDDNIYHFNPAGATLNSVSSGGLDLTDIDIASDGTLIVGERFGRVILTNETLNLPTTITDIGNVASFVAFASQPVVAGSHKVILGAGGSASDIDFGNYQPASIGNYVWEDLNEDGLQDGVEPGLSGVPVQLNCLGPDNAPYTADDLSIDSAATDGSGNYSFGDVAPGNYYLSFTTPASYVFTLQDQGGDDTLDSDVDSAGLTISFTVSSNQNTPTWDAGLYNPPPTYVNIIEAQIRPNSSGSTIFLIMLGLLVCVLVTIRTFVILHAKGSVKNNF